MPILTRPLRLFAVSLLTVLFIAGCGSVEERANSMSARELYLEARQAMQSGQYREATVYYQRLQARFPFGPYSTQGMLELAYAYWKAYQPQEALAIADQFIKQHPTHPHVDYAYYLKGLINFERNLSLAARFFADERSRRDQSHARAAFLAFKELVERFPESPYAADARQRMLFLRKNMALHELHIARYYLGREAYVGAINRAAYLLKNYGATRAAADALVVMSKAYKQLDMPGLAKGARRVLQYNYPNHPYITGESRDDDFLGWLWPFG